MANIFWQLRANVNDYKHISYVNEADWTELSHSISQSLHNQWKPIEMCFPRTPDDKERDDDYVANEVRLLGDLILAPSSIFVIDQKAHGVLHDLVARDVEFLELYVWEAKKNLSFYALNVTRVVDCLDRVHTKVGVGAAGTLRIWEYVFRSECLEGIHVFKLVDDLAGPIFVSEEFKIIVEKHDLTGFVFEEIPGVIYW